MRALILTGIIGASSALLLHQPVPNTYTDPWNATAVSGEQRDSRRGMVETAMAAPSPLPSAAESGAQVEEAAQTTASKSSTAETLRNLRTSLEECMRECNSLHAYSATLEQQVRLKDTVREKDMMDLKIRREPFSVFMVWHRDSQEVLYVEGKHNGRLLAHPTRGMTALRKVWRIKPESSQAMKNSRHPVTKLGIEKLCEETLEFHQGRDFSPEGVTATETTAMVGTTPCRKFVITFKSREVGKEFSKSQLTFDPQTKLLLAVENDGWTEDGKPNGLLERYVYHNLSRDELTDRDFDHKNPDYNLTDE